MSSSPKDPSLSSNLNSHESSLCRNGMMNATQQQQQQQHKFQQQQQQQQQQQNQQSQQLFGINCNQFAQMNRQDCQRNFSMIPIEAIDKERGQKRRRRERTTYNQAQLNVLHEVFLTTKYPDIELRRQLACKLNLAESSVQIWFKNHRAKARKLVSSEGNIIKHSLSNDDYSSSNKSLNDIQQTVIYNGTMNKSKLINGILSNNSNNGALLGDSAISNNERYLDVDYINCQNIGSSIIYGNNTAGSMNNQQKFYENSYQTSNIPSIFNTSINGNLQNTGSSSSLGNNVSSSHNLDPYSWIDGPSQINSDISICNQSANNSFNTNNNMNSLHGSNVNSNFINPINNHRWSSLNHSIGSMAMNSTLNPYRYGPFDPSDNHLNLSRNNLINIPGSFAMPGMNTLMDHDIPSSHISLNQLNEQASSNIKHSKAHILNKSPLGQSVESSSIIQND